MADGKIKIEVDTEEADKWLSSVLWRKCKAYKAGISAVQEVLGAMAYYNGQGVVAATGFTK